MSKNTAVALKEGKYVTVRNFHGELLVCAVDHQGNPPQVDIYEREHHMAFRFHRNNKDFFIKAEEKDLTEFQSLQLGCFPPAASSEPTDEPSELWFEKEPVGSDTHYGLKTVQLPNRYLTIVRQSTKKWIAALSDSKHSCALVTMTNEWD